MFWILHILAALFFFPALFITIPLHLICSAVKDKKPTEEGKGREHWHFD